MAHQISRRLLIPIVASGLLLAASAGSALAKCEGPNPPDFCNDVVAGWASGYGPGAFDAGTQRSVELFVSKGEQPYDAVSVLLTFTNDATVVNAPATLTSLPGVWRANVTLPDAGRWSINVQVVDAQGEAASLHLDPVYVPVPRIEPPATPVTPVPPAPPTFPALPIALLLAGIAAAGAAAYGLRQRTRRQSAPGLAAVSQSERSS